MVDYIPVPVGGKGNNTIYPSKYLTTWMEPEALYE